MDVALIVYLHFRKDNLVQNFPQSNFVPCCIWETQICKSVAKNDINFLHGCAWKTTFFSIYEALQNSSYKGRMKEETYYLKVEKWKSFHINILGFLIDSYQSDVIRKMQGKDLAIQSLRLYCSRQINASMYTCWLISTWTGPWTAFTKFKHVHSSFTQWKISHGHNHNNCPMCRTTT